ncbi:hypothetical protein LTR53_005364 [Teratosphaeriaceae sp. CCFEE 6253]|nr:hypothetical protein LTR53_005364 [Teratosphaeriaceae sp. CCFEE 6253]
MAYAGNQLQWIPDTVQRLYYYIDRDGGRVYSDGTRIAAPVPSATPRALLPPPVPQSQWQSMQIPTDTSPTSVGERFSIAGSAQRSPPQSPTPDRRTLARAMGGLEIGANTPQPPPQPPQPQPLQSASGPVRANVSVVNGVRTVVAQDPNSRVTVAIGTGPPELITDPAVLSDGIKATRALYGTPGNVEELYSNFRKKKQNFFIFGRVFLILWSEPAGENITAVHSVLPDDRSAAGKSGIIPGRYSGERIYSKVRRFVVVRAGTDYCTALPVMSYGYQGVSKRSVNVGEHGIIYTGSTVPDLSPAESAMRGGSMRSTAIRVVPDTKGETLDALSRLDYAKVHTIHHNLKVAAFGNVHPDSMAALENQWRAIWLGPGGAAGTLTSTAAGAARETSNSAPRQRMQRTGSVGSGSSQSAYIARAAAIPEEDESQSNSASAATSSRARPQGDNAPTRGGAPALARATFAPITASEVDRARQVIAYGVQQGRSEAGARDAVIQQYVNAGHPRERAVALVPATLPQETPSTTARREHASQAAQGGSRASGSSEEESDDDGRR